jgi:selenocysteine lyase/cysteine desulfurase
MSYVSVVGLTVAMDQLLTIGIEKLEHHAAGLGHLLVGAVEPHSWRPFRQLEDPAASAHIISLERQGEEFAETLERLRATGIVCSSRGGRLRISLAPFNDENDIEALVNALV